MEEYRHGSHTVFRFHAHLVWCTKYRKPVLRGDVGHRMRELARQICSDLDVEIMSGVDAPTEFQTQHMSDKEALLCSAMYDFETGALAPIE